MGQYRSTRLFVDVPNFVAMIKKRAIGGCEGMLVWTVKYKESRNTLISCRIELHKIFNRTERLWTLRRDNWRFRIQLQRYIFEATRKSFTNVL